MKTELDELLDLYSLWANSTDDIDDILDAFTADAPEGNCGCSLNASGTFSKPTWDIPF